jgi:hypothetical protein
VVEGVQAARPVEVETPLGGSQDGQPPAALPDEEMNL